MGLISFLTGKEGQSIRQDEINGKQHKFHSFPKEFQAWHNTQYMLEKKAVIDMSTISDGALNGMMWQAIGDGVKFGMTSALAITFAILKVKLSPNIWGFIVSLMVFIPWLIYSIYHFAFYAKIRAQVVGPLTKNAFRFTAQTFYETYFGMVVSLSIALVFILNILDDLVLLLRDIIIGLNPEGLLDGYLKIILTWFHNFFVELLTPPESFFGMVLYNNFSSMFIFLGSMLFLTYVFEKYVYEKRKVVVQQEKILERNLSGYPIDNALDKLHEWREKNGV